MRERRRGEGERGGEGRRKERRRGRRRGEEKREDKEEEERGGVGEGERGKVRTAVRFLADCGIASGNRGIKTRPGFKGFV